MENALDFELSFPFLFRKSFIFTGADKNITEEKTELERNIRIESV